MLYCTGYVVQYILLEEINLGVVLCSVYISGPYLVVSVFYVMLFMTRSATCLHFPIQAGFLLRVGSGAFPPLSLLSVSNFSYLSGTSLTLG